MKRPGAAERPPPRLRAAPAEAATRDRRLRRLAPPGIAWVLLEGAEGAPCSVLPALVGRLAPDAVEWVARLDGPADHLRYLLELAGAEGVEARAGPARGAVELTLPAGHPLAAGLFSAPEADACTVVLLAGAAAAAAVGRGRARRALIGAGAHPGPALAAAAAAGAVLEERPRAAGEPQRRRRPGLPSAAAAALLIAAAAVWAMAPPRSGPDPRLEAGPAPQARQGPASAVDGRSRELVLFGGIAGSAPEVDLGDTWTRGVTGWRLRRPAISPPARFGAVMADDPAEGRVVLFGGRRRGPRAGILVDTWTWDGNAWSRPDTSAGPPPGAAARALAWDAATRSLVLVTAGPDGSLQTWTWEGDGWSPRPGAATPEVGWMAAAPDGAVIAVGQPDPGNRGPTWRWNGSRWERRTPATAVRVEPLSALLAYDPTTRRTVLAEVEFHDAQGAPAGGTWTWDGATWTEHHSTPAVVGAFDVTQPVVAGDRPLVLLGGPLEGGAYRDAWLWDGSAWRRS